MRDSELKLWTYSSKAWDFWSSYLQAHAYLLDKYLDVQITKKKILLRAFEFCKTIVLLDLVAFTSLLKPSPSHPQKNKIIFN